MKPVVFTYRNYKGEHEVRTVIPTSVDFLSDPGFGYQPGWFLTGIDVDRKEKRSFFLANIILPSPLGILLRFEVDAP